MSFIEGNLTKRYLTMRACLCWFSFLGLLLLLTYLALSQAPQPQRIVFARVFPQPGQIGLFIAAADGSKEHPLVTPDDIDYNPVWAPDGASIVFTSERNGS